MAPSKIPLPVSARGKANKEKHSLPPRSMAVPYIAPSCPSTRTTTPSTKVRPLVPKHSAPQNSRANISPQRTNANGHDLAHAQPVQQAWNRRRSCSASTVPTACGQSTTTTSTTASITGPGMGGAIAERRHRSRIRSESLRTDLSRSQQQETETLQQNYRQQVPLQPPTLSDAESLSRLEVPLRQVTNSSNVKNNSDVSSKTPVPGDTAVAGQEVGIESYMQPLQKQQALGSHGHKEERGGIERTGGGMASVETDIAAETKAQGSNQPSESVPVVITPNSATLRKCQSTHVYFLDHYIDLLSYLKDRKERTREFKKNLARQKLSPEEASLASHSYYTHERMRLRQRRTRTTAVQFQILTQVGQGGFGEVFLARKSDTAELCALKRMSKRHLHLQDEVQHILTERDVLTATRSEWHVRLLYSFQDPDYVYLAMEFVPGGDVRTMLSARGVLREEDTRLYFAEMVLAIDALHQQGYIHRDLKPENFLIDSTGHIKLTDFGLSKGQLAEGRIAELKRRLEKVKDSMEPVGPTLRRSGGSSVLMNPLGRLYGSGMLGEVGARSTKLGGAGGSFANLNGILHRSPSHLLWGSSANLGGGIGGTGGGGVIENNSLLSLSSQKRHIETAQQQHPEIVPEEGQELRNEGIRRAFSIVGSADYMAPEILASLGYDYGVDYWSLGCILFEFLAGYSPFQGEDTRQTCVNVWHWRRVLRRPMYDTEENLEFNLTDEAWDLITRLITDREERYTTLSQVKQHPWLAGLDWENLRSTKASFVPVLQTPMDTSYFDDFSNPVDMASYKDVMLRQAQVHEAEIAASAAAAASSALVGGSSNCSSGSLPYVLRVQDPWKGAFVGFTFRHQRK